MTDKALRLALLAGSVLLGLYALDIGVRLFGGSAPESSRPQPPFGDMREPVRVILDLRNEGVDAHAYILPQTFLSDDGTNSNGSTIYPLGSISHVTTVFCKRKDDGQYVVYESDGHGFNNPAETWSEPNLDMVLIGDSFAAGHCVSRDESIAGHLRRLGYSVLALAMSGNGPLIELGTLVEYGSAVQPGVVLWTYFEHNDLLNLHSEMQSPLLGGYLEEGFSQGLGSRQDEVDRALRRYETQRTAAHRAEELRADLGPRQAPRPGWISRGWSKVVSIATLSHLRARLSQLRTRPGARQRSERLPSLASPEQLQAVLARAQGVVEEWNGQLVFVYLPHRVRYLSDTEPDDDQLRQRDTVLSVVEALGIPVIDMHEVFAEHAAPESLFIAENRYVATEGRPRTGYHYSPYGYGIVAEAIEARLGLGQRLTDRP